MVAMRDTMCVPKLSEKANDGNTIEAVIRRKPHFECNTL